MRQQNSYAWADCNQWRGIELGFGRNCEETFSYKMIIDLQCVVSDADINSDEAKFLCSSGKNQTQSITLKETAN